MPNETIYWIMFISGGYFLLNGIGHTVAIIYEKKEYDRIFAYYILIGVILVNSGAIQMLLSKSMADGDRMALCAGILSSSSIVALCLTTLRWLPSYGSLIIAIGQTALLMVKFLSAK